MLSKPVVARTIEPGFLRKRARFLKNPGSMVRATTGFDNILARYGAPASASGEPR